MRCVALRFISFFLDTLVAPGYLDGWTGWLWAPFLLS
jgi:hypothetical protein